MNISIRHIEHFIAVAQELHFRRAAQLANVAQPALSRSVQTLENELGVQLFARNNRNVRLTKAGKEFLAGCTDIVSTMELAIDRSVRAGQTEFGGLNIGYTYIAMCGELSGLIAKFEAQYPTIAIEPICVDSMDQLERLRHDKLDICFLTGPIGENTLGCEVFKKDEFVAITNRNDRFINKSTLSVEELSQETILLRPNTKAATFNQHVYKFFAQAGLEPNIEFVDQDHVGLLGKTSLDKGVCISTAGYGCVYQHNLQTLKITGIDSTLPTMMAWRKEVQSASITTFTDFIRLHANSSTPEPTSTQSSATAETI